MIPQANPKAGYLAQRADIDAAIARVLDNGWYIMGEEVAAFEQEFATFAQTRYAVGVASGTDALILSLRALEIGPGDAVITVSHTAVATVAAIEIAGATPVLVDIAGDWTMDPAALQRLLKAWPTHLPKAKAIIPVHLYGQPANMERLTAIAEEYGLFIVEDCSQAHGARLHNRSVGGWSQIAAYSLYPTKNLGALGDAGIVSTDDPALYEKMCALRQYGWRSRYISDIPGINSRLDPIQAAVLRVKLQVLDEDTARRRAIAGRYDTGLSGLTGLTLPCRAEGYAPVFHQYVVNAGERRDALQLWLKVRDILTVVHYPVPVHLQPAYAKKIGIGPGGLAKSELAARSVLSLPMFPQLMDDDVDCVIDAVRSYWLGA